MKCIKSITVCFLAIMFSLLFSPPGVWCAEKISEPFKYSGYTSPEYDGFTRTSEYAAMSDGVKLAATICTPSEGPSAGPFPVLFTYTPYHRESIDLATGELKIAFSKEVVEFFTSYGYVWVFANMRGGGASFGTREAHHSPPLASDGKELVDWIAAQSWCDGNVGMLGLSYVAWSQFATAGEKPAALKCILPTSTNFDLYINTDYPGGIYNIGVWGWLRPRIIMLDQNYYNTNARLFPGAPVIDEDADGDLADEIPLDLDGSGSFLDDGYQLPGNPPQYSDGNERQHIYYLATLEHLGNKEFLESPNGLVFRDAIGSGGYTFHDRQPGDRPVYMAESGIPVYNTGGWFDIFITATTQWHSTLQATNPSRLLIGPNNHSGPGFSKTGPNGPYWEYFGESKEEIWEGYNLEKLRFLDHYLKGTENNIDKEPPVYIYVMNGEGWRFENEWPLDRQKTETLYFEEGNTLSVTRKNEGYDNYTADYTHDSREVSSGKNRYTLGSQDNVDIRNEKDLKCLTYTMDPLEEDMEVTGHPIVHLWISSTADYGDFFVYLEDIDEKGDAYFVTDGLHRAGFATLVPNEDILLTPDAGIDVLPDTPWHGYDQAHFTDRIFANSNIAEVVFDLQPTSWVFKKGHRIRVSIACADWPTLILHPKLSPTNDPADPNTIVPTITVYRDSEYQSRIDLPVIPSKPDTKVSEPLKYSGYTSPDYTGYERSAQYVTVADGTRLAMVWYTPTKGPSDGPFPVIFTYYPYHYEVIDLETGELIPHFKDATEFYLSYGYVIAVADMRGSGASFGVRNNVSKQLGLDGKELVDWIAQQPWCDGNIGMMGASYMGGSQYATAARKPAALKCIMPGFTGFDSYSRIGQYAGGIRQRGGLFSLWGPSFFDKNVYWPDFPYPLGKPATPVIDEDGDGELIDEIPIDQDGDGSFVEDYQLPDNPPQYIDGEDREHIYFKLTLEHMQNPYVIDADMRFRDDQVVAESDDTFAKYGAGDYPVGLAESGIPIYHTGGWFDQFVTATTQWYKTLEKTSPSKLIIAPVVHAWMGVIAEPRGPYVEYFGENLAELELGFNLERLRYFDYHLKGISNGIDTEPPVRIFVMNGEGWRAENEWPLARQKMTDYYFNRENSLANEKSPEGSDYYQVDFTHDARDDSTDGSRWGGFGKLTTPRTRTSEDEQCLTYTMKEPLEEDIEITGHPVVHLWVSSTADYGDFFVYLEDVDEDGNAYYVTEGQHRAGFATLIPNEDLLPEGSRTLSDGSALDILPDIPWHGFKESDYTDGVFANNNIVEQVFDLFPTSWVFRKGHRIRVSIAGSDYPTFVLHPELSSANDPADPDNIVPMITVRRSETYLSRIELPVIPESGGEYALGDADGNGKIDIDDALIIAQYDVELKTQDEVPGFAAADVDGNGKVDIFDALRIAEFVVGLIPEL